MSNMPRSDKEQVELSQIWSTTFTVKCGWWVGRKILKLLKEHNALCAVVIGYSFRDISVNNAFVDHICYNKNSRMIISAKSHSVKARIRRLFDGNIDRIATVSKYFGEDGFIDELQNKLSNEKSSIE